ncbi:MAG: RnfABCDGE type electron transport complex subunit D [Lachnospiraceae bacterium]|jgi:electron transport complex protein RnfD|nr:RnfABCDGE type electron transport complex subunit D [Lachnospiraceae bacterium]
MTDVRPFVKTSASTANLMAGVIAALLPAFGIGIWHYGIRAAILVGISVATAVACELVFCLIAGRKITIPDYSAAVTGFILGLMLPPSVPYYFPAIGAAVAILIVKMPFGGIGRNWLNPAAAGKLVLLIAFRTQMDNYSIGSFTSLTPITLAMNGNSVNLQDMLTGSTAGCIGTGSAIAILFAALFLIVTGAAGIVIPFFAIFSFVIVIILFGGSGWDPAWLFVQTVGGSMLFIAFICAQDYTTSPVTIGGRILYGIGFGALTAVLRLTVSVENAALYALLAMNLTSRYLDAHTMPKAFGTVQHERQVRDIESRRRANAASEKRREEIRRKQEEEAARRLQTEEASSASEEVNTRENNLSSDTTVLNVQQIRELQKKYEESK